MYVCVCVSVVACLLAFDWSEEGGGRGRGPLAAREHPEDRVAEGLAELAVEVGVDERVECRVEVAHPEDRVDHHRRRVRARLAAQVRDVVPQEEGQPAQDERAHDDAQGARRLVLGLPARVVLLLVPTTAATVSACNTQQN